MLSRTRLGVAVGVSLLASLAASGASSAAPVGRDAVVDVRARLLFEHWSRTGRTLPFFTPSRALERSGRAPLLVRFTREITPAERAGWEQLGLRIDRRLSSGATKVETSEEALAAMVAAGVVARATVDLRPAVTLRPLDLERDQIGLSGGLETYQIANGSPLTGKGVIVGDMDTSADPYHPAFFSPLPPVPWADADGDGRLTPEVDGIDLDGSETLEAGEILRLLDGRADSAGGTNTDIYGTDDSGLNPGWDYLFLDTNGDGKRSVGSDVGGAETLPAMGEPVFVADDVDGDGIVSIAERVIPLGGSKIRAIRHAGGTYVRGTNLATYPPTSAADNGRHATQVLSVVAGGQIGASRFLGIAPEAELVLNTFTEDDEPHTDKMQWLADRGADIIITELGFFGTEPADGSTELELLIDSLVDQGIVVISAAGNLGLSTKHALASIPASSSATSYTNDLVHKGGSQPSYVFFSVTWREGTADVGGSLTAPDGDIIALDGDVAGATTANGRAYSVAHGVTPFGAGYLLVTFTATPGLPAAGMQLSLKSKLDEPLSASLYILDNVSGWTRGTQWAAGDVDGCMVVPAFASRTVAVSAYAHHVGAEWVQLGDEAGALREYSGRGPDLWGDPGIDIASPDNPVTAYPDQYPIGSTHADGTRVRWGEFGGTSGAAPGVAGIVTLMKQANPALSGTALRDHLLAAARVDAFVAAGTAAMWGAGKVDLGIPRAAGAPPTAMLDAPAQAAPGSSVALSVSVMDDGDSGAIRARWDVGYDGTWDSDHESDLSISAVMPEGGAPLDVKVEVIDADGWTARASARITASPSGAGGSGGAAGSGGMGGEDPGGAPPPPPGGCVCGCEVPGQTTPRPAGVALLMACLGLALRARGRP